MTGLLVRDVLTPRPGREQDLENALRALVPAEFAAARPHGATSFALFREDGGSHWLLEELWRDREAFDAFHAAYRPPELKAFLARAADLLAAPLEDAVSYWSPADTLSSRSIRS